MTNDVIKSLFETGSAYVPHKLFRLVSASLDNSYPDIKYHVSVDKKRYYTISISV